MIRSDTNKHEIALYSTFQRSIIWYVTENKFLSYVVIGFDFDNIVDDAAFPAAAEVGMDDADNDVDGFANQVIDVAGCVYWGLRTIGGISPWNRAPYPRISVEILGMSSLTTLPT